MTAERPTSHAAEGDSLLADRLRAIPGLVRKAPEAATEAARPTPAVATADPFGRAASKVPPGFVEVPAPAGTRTEPGAPRTRHFRAAEPGKVQRRTMVDAIRRPDPAA